jgi:hypothetical protein
MDETDDPIKKEERPELLTKAETAAIIQQETELLAEWIKNLSPEESTAWLDAHVDELETKVEESLLGVADFEAVMRIVQGHGNPIVAIAAVRNKEHRTLVEAEALDAFERIKYKFIRIISPHDPVALKIVDLLEASHTKTKAEFEAMLAQSDQ